MLKIAQNGSCKFTLVRFLPMGSITPHPSGPPGRREDLWQSNALRCWIFFAAKETLFFSYKATSKVILHCEMTRCRNRSTRDLPFFIRLWRAILINCQPMAVRCGWALSCLSDWNPMEPSFIRYDVTKMSPHQTPWYGLPCHCLNSKYIR